MALNVELDGIFSDEVAETVVYTPNGGTAVSVPGVVDRGEYKQEQTRNGVYLVKTAAVLISAEDISTPDPDGDTITLDGLEWGVYGFEPVGANIAYTVHITRRELISKKARI